MHYIEFIYQTHIYTLSSFRIELCKDSHSKSDDKLKTKTCQ